MNYFNIILNIICWLGVPLMVALIFAITRKQYRPYAIATLAIAIPLSLMVALNNNQENIVRNFFMGIVMFGVPLLLHAWLVLFIKQQQS